MKKQRFNDNWLFHEGSGSSLEALIGGAGKEPKKVTLPHDASVERERNPQEPNGSGNGFFREENMHYTKEFSLDAADADKNIWLEFEGAYQNSFVYINGSFAAKHPYGYSNFYVDATRYVRFDRPNQIKVVLKNGVPSGRWYTGGGLYRDVNLMVADRLHLVPDGIRLAAVEAEEDQAVIRAESVIEYTGTGTRAVTLTVQLLEDGKPVAQDTIPVTVEEHSRNTYRQKLYVEAPKRWDEENPYLYTYKAFLCEGETVLDTEEGTFGIRKLQLDRKHGLRVNGKEVKLRGGCIHHDNGVTGTAEFADTAEFRVRKLKEAGYNAIRSSHYPMGRRLLEACDRLGMYVMDEFSDVWTTTKVDFDYGMHMAEWWEQDITNLVNKDYNHPCVIMYSIGNEIPETGNRFDVQWGKKLADKLRSLDDSRYVTNSLNLLLSIMDRMGELMAAMAGGAGQENAGAAEAPVEINSAMSSLGDMMEQAIASDFAGEATEEAFGQVDIAGYNYGTVRYEKDLEKYPNRIIVGSETYPGDLAKNWELVEKHPAIIGDFSWTSWDYLGEAGIGRIGYNEESSFGFYAPYPYKAAYCGDINLIGDRRPVSYWREIIWGLREAPYLSVQPPKYYGMKKNLTPWCTTDAVRSWNWSGFEGKPVIVEVYADADEAELFANGVSVGRKAVGEEKKCIALFDTVYTPGTLEVVVYKDGKETGRDAIATAKEEVQIVAHAEKTQIAADESELAYVEICLVDEDGVLNPGCDKEVSISVEGPGTVLGFGSANPESEENYFDRTAKAYEGRLRAAIRGTGEKGTITVTLHAEGCRDEKAEIEAV